MSKLIKEKTVRGTGCVDAVQSADKKNLHSSEVPLTFLAKSSPVEGLEYHTKELLQRYQVLKEHFGSKCNDLEWEVLRDAAIFHDMGKSNPYFQSRIGSCIWEEQKIEGYQEIKELFRPYRHNLISPMFIRRGGVLKKYREMANKLTVPSENVSICEASEAYDILIKSVVYHHAADVDFVQERLQQFDELLLYFRKLLESRTEVWDHYAWVYEMLEKGEMVSFTDEGFALNQGFINMFRFTGKIKEKECKYYFLKGLLNKLDYTASAGMPVEEFPPEMEEIGRMTAHFMESRMFSVRAVQKYMQEHRGDNVIVESATGSGKTEAALMWIGNDKGFYTLPLKVSINAMYHRIKSEDGIGYPHVNILHGDAFSYYLEDSGVGEMKNGGSDGEEKLEDAYRKYNFARLLSARLTVCTVDQLFKYVYKYNGGEMPFASMVLGKTVIDEIQMYEPRLLATLICGLKMLADAGGKFAIITATFPRSLYTLFNQYIKRNGAVMMNEEVPQFQPEKFYGALSCRHKLTILKDSNGNSLGEFDFDKIIELSEKKKVLVIANTVKRTQQIGEILEELCESRGENIIVRTYHSNYILRDRKKMEKEILLFAPNRRGSHTTTERVIWVTTSIVEASLDIDFDCLFTELRSIDSLIQRLGRIYRGRSLLVYKDGIDTDDVEPNVYVLFREEGIFDRDRDFADVQKRIYKRSCDALVRHIEQNRDGLIVECPERDDVRRMMDFVYDEENHEVTGYYALVKKHISELLDIGVYDLKRKEVDECFRGIRGIKIIPERIMREHGEEIEKYRQTLCESVSKYTEKKRAYIRKEQARSGLEEFCVSVSTEPLVSRILSRREEFELFRGSDIFVVNMDYEFDDRKLQGKGLTGVWIEGKSYDARLI